jgi:tetratricopeptide (TPR) repeat protein
VVEAVQCAVAMQRELKARNAQLPPHRRMEFRIGVNLGDVIAEGERIYGDGVNIAARLEGLAEAGGLCISGTVYDQVKTRLALDYEDLGAQDVKNIAEPVRVYRVRIEPRPAAPQTRAMDEGRSSGPRKRLLLLGAGLVICTLALVTVLWTAHLRSRPESAGALQAQGHDTLAQGHLLYNQGRLDEALIAYRHITDKSTSTPGQQAMAYNRLGQIYTVQGNVAQALECYDKAISQRQDMAVAYANKAYLLEQLGRRQEALVSYRQALQLSPNDVLTTTLFSETQRRAQLALDKEKQERIDRLVAELLQLHKEGRQPSSPSDDWTSPPLTLAFMDMQIQGTPSPRAGEPEFFGLRLTQAMRTHERLQLVEREVMDKLLAELKLSAAALTESQTALQVGKLLAARLIATSTFRRSGETGQIGVRLIETETGRIQAMVTETFETSETLDRAVAQLSQTLLTQMRQRYPLQGRIARLTPEVVTLDIGAAQGVTSGVTLQVFGSEEPIERNGKVVDYHRLPVGLVEVTHVAAQFAQARVLEQTVALQAGWKVQEVQQQ